MTRLLVEIEGLGKALLVAVSAMSTFKLVSKLMNMQIGKSKKMTLGKLLIDKKAYMMEKARTMGQKAQLAQEYIDFIEYDDIAFKNLNRCVYAPFIHVRFLHIELC